MEGLIPAETTVYCCLEPGKNNRLLYCRLQDQEHFFVDPGEDVYTGTDHCRACKPGDLVVNATEG